MDFYPSTRGPTMWKCLCGSCFASKRELNEHIGLHNWRWPRSSPDDKHRNITVEKQN